MAYTQGKQDGGQKFGFTEGTFDGFIVESYTETTSSNRVDIDDGNGKPIGSAVVPARIEVSLTVQYGQSSNGTFDIGDVINYDGNNIGITSVEAIEAQSDYVRMSISGYKLTNGSTLTDLTDIT
tara:strand:+ start:5720 stop:6091 length:372 start_codon:yes stop_codon:yes gene_type:complete